MSFGEHLKAARKSKSYTQAQLAELLGYGGTTISEYEQGNNKPNLDAFIQICKILDCDANYLLQDDITNIESKFNPEDQILIDKYKALSSHDREIVDYILDMEAEEQTTIYCFPIFYQSAAAGIGRLSETEEYQMEEFMLKSIPKKAVFGMYIKGHSMEKNIYENDIVLIDPSAKVSNNLEGKIVVALFGDELVCKRFSVNVDDQTYDFTSDNPADKDKGRFHQKQSDFSLIGKVVKILHAHEMGNGLFIYNED